MHPYRTHTCNELRASDAGKTVRLSGWMFRLRDHGCILFVDLRDHYGLPRSSSIRRAASSASSRRRTSKASSP